MPSRGPFASWMPQAMRGVLWARPILAVRAEEDDAAVAAETVVEVGDGCGQRQAVGWLPEATRSTAHLPRTSFMMGSPQPVRETAADWLSA